MERKRAGIVLFEGVEVCGFGGPFEVFSVTPDGICLAGRPTFLKGFSKFRLGSAHFSEANRLSEQRDSP